jgi:hypothetical protein
MAKTIDQVYRALWHEEQAALKKHADACVKHQASGAADDRDEVFMTLGAASQAKQTREMFEAGGHE